MASPFYVRRLGTIDGLTIWRVDGHRIRDQRDIEFTNGHHHFSRRYVPRREIWLDREAPGAEETELWLMRQMLERERMLRGDSYLSALRVASRIERDARLRIHGVAAYLRPGEVQERARLRRIGSAAGREVWLVDGRAVRDFAYVDFTQGGHGFRYRFIPRREIWIDDAVRPSERAAVLHHEAVEVGLMADGMRYAEAHQRASAAERRFRQRARVVLR